MNEDYKTVGKIPPKNETCISPCFIPTAFHLLRKVTNMEYQDDKVENILLYNISWWLFAMMISIITILVVSGVLYLVNPIATVELYHRIKEYLINMRR